MTLRSLLQTTVSTAHRRAVQPQLGCVVPGSRSLCGHSGQKPRATLELVRIRRGPSLLCFRIVTTDQAGRVLASHWPYYLDIARRARDETDNVIAENPKALPASSITAIIMSALTVEAFINELGEAADMEQTHRDRHGTSSAALDALQDLSNTLKEIEGDKGSIGLKYQIAYKVLSGRTFPRGSSPFQEFQQLVALRNLLVHLKPGDKVNATGQVEPREKLIKDFQQRGLTRTRGPQPDDSRGGTSWLLEIETVEMANWAYGAACGIIKELGKVISTDPPRTGTIDRIKDFTQKLPL